MRHLKRFLARIAATACLLAAASAAQAQASHTWVSGVGDDANPCSRTAPCKTFAGAISKTAAAGEINCIDPGGFGGVTITKSINIDCSEVEAGVLVGGTNGIIINAAATDVVRLRGLDIFGVSSALVGVKFLAGGSLHIDDCRIKNFNAANSWGIGFQPSGAAELFVSNTLVTDNGNPAVPATAGGGILVQPTGSGTARAVITNTDLVNNAQGLRADSTGASAANPIRVEIEDSSASHSAFAGIAAVASTQAVTIIADHTSANYNLGAGYTAVGAGAVIRVGRSTVTGNGTGTAQQTSGVIESYQTNQITGNTSDGTRVNISQN